jgi:hypothetical protein
MTFYFDGETGVMHIAFEKEAGPCFYIETPTGVFRIERDTNRLISVAIPFFYEKVADGSLSLPDISSSVLPPEVIHKLRA